MRFGFFVRVPWWLMLFVLAVELAVWAVYVPLWCIWKLWDIGLERRDNHAIDYPRPARQRRSLSTV